MTRQHRWNKGTPPPSTTEIPFTKVPDFCKLIPRVLCSECKLTTTEDMGKWIGCGKGQKVFICNGCRDWSKT